MQYICPVYIIKSVVERGFFFDKSALNENRCYAIMHNIEFIFRSPYSIILYSQCE